MISVDTSKTSDDLRKYIADVERRLTNMVVGFAYEVTVKLVEATPIGNANIVAAGADELQEPELTYYGFYAARASRYPSVAPMEVGYHKSAWRYSENGIFELIDGSPEYDSEERVLSQAESNYKLGDTFYIGAKGFDSEGLDSFLRLEEGRSQQAPTGIKEPAWQQLAGTYLVDLQRYYNEG